MREIKFRARCLEDFDNGNIVVAKGQWFYFSLNNMLVKNVKNEIQSIGNVFWDNGKFFISGFHCDFDTLGEYTGLKDKNNFEIFEGDIVRFTQKNLDPKWYHPQEVFWNYDRWGMKNNLNKIYSAFIEKHTERRIKIIGNIYENPELLDG